MIEARIKMLVSDFDFFLPPERIAQVPADRRDASRLLLLDRGTGGIGHGEFRSFADRLDPGDLLVLNDTKVIPARLFGQRSTGGKVELLLLEELSPECWNALVKPARKLKVGERISFGHGLEATIEQECPEGVRVIRFDGQRPLREVLWQLGEMPLPPYITERSSEPGRYQTVYAEHEGSVAAPTAGLHFTPELLLSLASKGVEIARVTLHVGLGTFRPMTVERVEDHPMHSERFTLPPETAEAIKMAKARGGRVVAVGTTAARTLEHCAAAGLHEGGTGTTSIFIYPGYRFRAVDALLTNFHLPCSTLVMLVSAFVDQACPGRGREIVLSAYQEAIEREYRFFSYGDAMFLS